MDKGYEGFVLSLSTRKVLVLTRFIHVSREESREFLDEIYYVYSMNHLKRIFDENVTCV